MALHLILGNSGSGKTYGMYQELIRQAEHTPDRTFLIIVPEQFTLQTQRELVELHPDHVIRNIEVLSFDRLAYRVFSELGTKKGDTLEEVGKSLVLRRVAEEKAKDLTVLSRQMKKPGYISEMKSLISEFQQYDISSETLTEMGELDGFPESFRKKMHDIRTMYDGFNAFLEDRYITREEILDLLTDVIGESAVCKDAVFSFDEFTGFTPIQKKLLYRIFSISKDVYVTVTIDPGVDYLGEIKEEELFSMSKKKIRDLIRIAEDTNTPIASPLYLDGTDSPRFIKGGRMLHLEQCMAKGIKAPYQGQSQDVIELLEFSDPRRELAYVASKIKDLCRTKGFHYRDFGLVCPDLEAYAHLAPNVFQKNDIPLFVDGKTTVEGHPLIELVRGLFEVLASDFSYWSVFHMLRSGIPMVSVEEIDRFDNYVMAVGVKGYSSYQKDFPYLPKGFTAEELLDINEIRQRIMSYLEPFRQGIQDADGNVEEMAKALVHVLDALDVRNFLEKSALREEDEGNYSQAREDRQVFGMLISLLHKMADILSLDRLSTEEFVEILNAGFETFKVGLIPPSNDRVVLGDIQRTRFHEIKVLFLLGANDGQLPKNDGRGGILSDLERNMLRQDGFRLSETTRERSFEQRFYLYMILTKPTMGLYISTTQRGFDGKEAKPSYLMQEMMQYFPDCRIHRMDAMDLLELAYHPAALDELLILLLRDFMENENQGDSLVLSGLLLWYQKNDRERLKEILSSVFYVHEPEQLALASGEKLSRSNLQGSVTKLEKYASCAYAYFLQYGLHLGERQEHELDQMDVGNLYHDVLKKYSDTLMNDPKYQAYDFSTVTDQISDEILKSCIALSYEKMWKQELFMDPRSAYTLREMQSTLKRSIQLLRNQVQRGRFLPQAFEVKLSEIGSLDALNYELSNGDLMHFSGQIDRIDTMETDDKVYVKIIDYKSGSQTLDPARVKAGLQIQILVYMDAALEGQERSRGKETVPAAVYLYHVKDQTVDEKKGDMTEAEIREEVLKAVGRDGLINEDETVLYALDEHPGGKNSLTSPVYPSKSSRISEKRFREILGEVRELIQTEGEEIRKGNIQAMPYRMKDANGCAYCSYHAICGFDPSLEGYDYRDVDPYVTWKGEEDV